MPDMPDMPDNRLDKPRLDQPTSYPIALGFAMQVNRVVGGANRSSSWVIRWWVVLIDLHPG